MDSTEYRHWFKRATELFPPVVALFEKEQAKHRDWQDCLQHETLGDSIRILDDMHKGQIDTPQFHSEWWRLPSIVRVHASRMREDRSKWQQQSERRQTRHGERGKELGVALAQTIHSLGDGAADIYLRAVELMKTHGMDSKDACNQAAEELGVKWWEPIE